MQRWRPLHLGCCVATSLSASVYITSSLNVLLHQSGLLVIELVARDDCVAYAAEDQSAVFLLHLEVAVELALRGARKSASLVACVVVCT